MEAGKSKSRKEPRAFNPGVDNEEIINKLVAITACAENHAKVRRRKDGKLVISAVNERMIS